jgi:O-antigen/teichoic acid export membrane protein
MRSLNKVRAPRLIGNTLAQLVTPGLRMLLGLVLAATLSRYLGVSGFGQYALVFAYVATFSGVLTDWGLGTICLREISRHPDRRAALIGSSVTLQVVIALASYVIMLSSLLVVRFPRAVSIAVTLYGLTLLLTPLDLLALPFQADLRVARLLPASLAGALVNFTLVMGFIAVRSPLVIIVGGSLLSLAIQYAWIARLSMRALGNSVTPTRAHWRYLLKEAWPLAVSTIVATGLQQGPLLALSLLSFEAVGLFNAANKIPQQLLLLPLAIRATTFPLLAESWITDRARFARLLERLVGVTLVIVTPMIVVGFGLAHALMPLLFGPGFTGAALPFALMLCVVGVLFPGIVLGEALIAAGFQRVNLAILVAGLPLLVVLLWILVPVGGATGAALALLGSYCAIVAATLVAANRQLAFKLPLSALACAALAGLLGFTTLRLGVIVGPTPASALAGIVAITTLGFLQPTIVRELWSMRPLTVSRAS